MIAPSGIGTTAEAGARDRPGVSELQVPSRSVTTVEIVLQPGRERSLDRRHPWVFSGAVAAVVGDPGPGDTVVVRGADGRVLGHAAYSPVSPLRARVWTHDADATIDETFIADRIRAAVERRHALVRDTDAVRLVFSEADGVPGLVADRYADTVVMQITAPGAERWRDTIADVIAGLDGVARVVERSDNDARRREGLDDRTGIVRGALTTEPVVISDRGLQFGVDVTTGHKTGFYLDQRDSRRMVEILADGREVLDAFSYTGGFAVAAARGGATAVVRLDSSAPALAMGDDNLQRNGLAPGEVIVGDAFSELRRMRDRRASFDMIVLDPPKFAATSKQVDRATRAYKDLNLLACKLLRPGGVLVTFSCSGAIGAELFQKVVAGAALDAGRDVRIVARATQPADHPVPLAFPEAEYLCGLVCQVD
jgi:23S rRNA (cytosine1962-C5)-methyltransferase